ncbi:hypothetical protein [Thermogymnomonas acidicola]|uniref:hypothetical protein n=1 Tax=Thermogymnomonas acidicola TaxID=399579 RepID=UPI0009462DF0|nr:hypothetical protein [Thermogymnomonas acidicola]
MEQGLSKYGFRLFEGGIPEGPKIRVVEIEDLDAEGCGGGTHLSSTGQIGMVKIIGTETIQEGVQRLTFVAGPPAALDHFQKEHAEMERIRLELKPQGSVSEAVSRLLGGEKIGLEKEVESLASAVAERYLEGMDGGGASGS